MKNNHVFRPYFFGGPDSLPWILARHEIPWLDVVLDPCASFLVFVVTGLLCLGIKEVAGFSCLIYIHCSVVRQCGI
jgi:hypothetical protein